MNGSKQINNIFLITVLLGILGSFVIGTIPMSIVMRLLLTQIVLIAPSIFYIIKFRMNLKETIRFHKIKISNVILILLFSYLVSPFMGLINMISMLFVDNVIQNTISVIVDNNILLVSLTFIAIIPSIFEESVYRGIFYNEYRKINVLKGMILSAFLFGVMHQNFNQFFYAFAMGMIFVLLIEATDSILAPMIVHFCINGSSVFTLYLMPKMIKVLGNISPETSEQLKQSMNAQITKSDILKVLPFNAVWAVITLILAGMVFCAIAKNSGRYDKIKGIFKKEREKEIEKEKLISAPLLIGIAICIGLMILSEISA